MFACASATGAAAHKNNEAPCMDVNLLFDPQSLSVHLCALMTMHVKYPYAVLIEFFWSSPLFVLSLRQAILTHAFHPKSIPIELFMKGK